MCICEEKGITLRNKEFIYRDLHIRTLEGKIEFVGELQHKTCGRTVVCEEIKPEIRHKYSFDFK